MSATSRHRITLAVAGFRALAERLRGSPWLVAATFGPPADEARIRAAERARGLPFPDDLRHLLAICDGFTVRAFPFADFEDDDYLADLDISGDHVIQHEVVSTDRLVAIGSGLGPHRPDPDAETRVVIVDVPQPELVLGVIGGADAPTVHEVSHGLPEVAPDLGAYLLRALRRAEAVTAHLAPELRASGSEPLRGEAVVASPPADEVTSEEPVFEDAEVLAFPPGTARGSLPDVDDETFALVVRRVPKELHVGELDRRPRLTSLALRLDVGIAVADALDDVARRTFERITHLEIEADTIEELDFLRAFPGLESLLLRARGDAPLAGDFTGCAAKQITLDGPFPAELVLPAGRRVALELRGRGPFALPRLVNPQDLFRLDLPPCPLRDGATLDLAPMTRLSVLVATGVPLAAHPRLESTSLTTLYAEGTGLRSFDASRLPALERVFLGNNPFTAFDWIASVPEDCQVSLDLPANERKKLAKRFRGVRIEGTPSAGG